MKSTGKTSRLLANSSALQRQAKMNPYGMPQKSPPPLKPKHPSSLGALLKPRVKQPLVKKPAIVATQTINLSPAKPKKTPIQIPLYKKQVTSATARFKSSSIGFFKHQPRAPPTVKIIETPSTRRVSPPQKP
jgi:hypothetical protein